MSLPAFVFHGFQPRQELFKLKSAEGSASNMESDFVIVLPGGVIVSLECKTTLDKEPLEKAVKQWGRLRQVLQEELGLGGDTELIKCVAYQKAGDGFDSCATCPNCAPFLLQFKDQ